LLVKFIEQLDHHYWSFNVNDVADDQDFLRRLDK